ncbi:MAG: helix-turn-helix domain-containing protein [Armatimonadota bacterium]
MSAEEFTAWLQEQLDRRGWDQAELARRSRITNAHISRIMSGENQAGPEASLKIARALHLPPEDVFRHAGLLPRSKATPEGSEELLYYYSNLDKEDQRRVLAMARAVFELRVTE